MIWEDFLLSSIEFAMMHQAVERSLRKYAPSSRVLIFVILTKEVSALKKIIGIQQILRYTQNDKN
jgi:hypothetical protein